MPGIQLPIGIETVNPVDADYKRGPWLTIAAALAGINIALRYNNLSFYVAGDPNEYYWLDTDLSDAGLLIRSSSGGASLPIVRYVYLVADASDALLMGGVASNVHTSFQTAYAAADALQITLGGNNIVEIKVGNTIGNQPAFGVITSLVGSLSLSAAYNFRVRIVGENPTVSVLGSITGAGLNIGNAATTPVVFANVSFQNINTSQNAISGNSGLINLRLSNVRIFSIDTSISNVLNTTGSGGNVLINTNGANLGFACNVGTILTSSQGPTSTAGNLTLNGSFITVSGVQLANNNLGGGILFIGVGSGIQIGNLVSRSVTPGPIAGTTTVTNTTFLSIDMTWPGSAPFPGDPVIKFINCTCSGEVKILQNGTTADPLLVMWNNGAVQNWVGNALTTLLAYNVAFWVREGSGIVNVISNLGTNSVLANCSVIKEGPATGACILTIGTGCTIKNTTFRGAAASIANAGAVTVISDNSIFDKPSSPLVTIELDGGFGVLVDYSSVGNFNYDGSLYKSATIDLQGAGGGPNSVEMYGLAIGQKYILNIINSTGTDTVQVQDYAFAKNVGVAQVGSSGGVYTPTATIGAIDQLLITFDGTTIWVTPIGRDFKF